MEWEEVCNKCLVVNNQRQKLEVQERQLEIELSWAKQNSLKHLAVRVENDLSRLRAEWFKLSDELHQLICIKDEMKRIRMLSKLKAKDVDSLGVKALKELALAINIPGSSCMKKDELLPLIKTAMSAKTA